MRIPQTKKTIFKRPSILKKGTWKQPIPNIYSNAINEINSRCKGMNLSEGQLNAHLIRALVSSPEKQPFNSLKTTQLLAHVKRVGFDRNHLFKIVKEDDCYERLVNHFTRLQDYEFVEALIKEITDTTTKEDCYVSVIENLIFDNKLRCAEVWAKKIDDLTFQGDNQFEIIKAYLHQNDRRSATALLNQIVDDYFRKQAEALIN